MAKHKRKRKQRAAEEEEEPRRQRVDRGDAWEEAPYPGFNDDDEGELEEFELTATTKGWTPRRRS